MKRALALPLVVAVALLVTLAGAGAPPAAATSAAYTLAPLDSRSSAAHDLNDSGQVVGWVGTGTAMHAALWQAGGDRPRHAPQPHR